MGHEWWMATVRTVHIVADFTTEPNVTPQLMSTCWDLPSQTKPALYCFEVPSDFSLCLKIHTLRTMFMVSCQGTNSHVLFLISSWNSPIMAWFQSGLRRGSRGEWGSGEKETKDWKANGCRSLEILNMPRVWIVRCDGAGGAGGVCFHKCLCLPI